MILLDENIPETQRQLLKWWRIRVKQIGQDIGFQGMQDDDQIIPLLRSLRQPTFFTRDLGFYDRRLCHRNYGIVCMAIGPSEVATFLRRLVRHRAFATKANRMGKVIRLTETRIHFWKPRAAQEIDVAWDD
ncbi:hypothetical protein AYO44_08615 [Planctomycetaceae bacterium SCGC AG-212-F19]|nr:hypothetical protein AYO44_08615 [Planctomycetaceae bacterium SCGC AG-212-F19]